MKIPLSNRMWDQVMFSTPKSDPQNPTHAWLPRIIPSPRGTARWGRSRVRRKDVPGSSSRGSPQRQSPGCHRGCCRTRPRSPWPLLWSLLPSPRSVTPFSEGQHTPKNSAKITCSPEAAPTPSPSQGVPGAASATRHHEAAERACLWTLSPRAWSPSAPPSTARPGPSHATESKGTGGLAAHPMLSERTRTHKAPREMRAAGTKAGAEPGTPLWTPLPCAQTAPKSSSQGKEGPVITMAL